MCGFVAGSTKNVNLKEIQAALNVITHRGPDGKKVLVQEEFFLAHARLSIVGLLNGEQPLKNEDNSIFAVVNGEFYDYEKIREKMRGRGHTFKTESDSEVLIHLYEEYGFDCLKFLHGEFSFVLYDSKEKVWFIARDRMGVRPLHYCVNQGQLLVASEAKSLLVFQYIPKELDKDALYFSQHLQYLPLDKTLFKGISMVKPAHYGVFKNGVYHEHAYWSLKDIEKNQHISFEEAKEKVVELLYQAVNKRLPQEVRWATHLSGGIDSGLVNAIAAETTKDFEAFTIQFTDDVFYDESSLATETARHIGINLNIIPVSALELFQALPQAVYHAEGLSINGHLGAKYLLNEGIKASGRKVALSGEGSDEIFMGYSHLKQDYLSMNSITGMEKHYLTGFQLPQGETLDLSAIRNQLGWVPTWIQAKSSMAHKMRPFWTPDFESDTRPYEEMAKELQGYNSPLKASSASWAQYCLSGYILKVLDDAQAMAHSIEGRLPFLDTELMSFAYSLPDELYFYENKEKGLLREGFKNALPASVIQKTKQSFMSPPVNKFLAEKEIQEMVERYVFHNKKLENTGWFELEKMKRFFSSEMGQKPEYEPVLMTFLTLGIFAEAFL